MATGCDWEVTLRKFLWLSLMATISSLLVYNAHATVFGELQGIVHDPQHRPISGAKIILHAAYSTASQSATTNQDGYFSLPAVPLGEYRITISVPGFNTARQTISVASGSSPILHFQLEVGSVHESVMVSSRTDAANVNSVNPTTTVSRIDVARTPGRPHQQLGGNHRLRARRLCSA